MFSCPSIPAPTVISSRLAFAEALLVFRGGLSTTDPSSKSNVVNVDLVRFLELALFRLASRSGLDDDGITESFFASSGTMGVLSGSPIVTAADAGADDAVSRIVLKKSRATTRSLFSMVILLGYNVRDAQLTLGRRRAFFPSLDYLCWAS